MLKFQGIIHSSSCRSIHARSRITLLDPLCISIWLCRHQQCTRAVSVWDFEAVVVVFPVSFDKTWPAFTHHQFILYLYNYGCNGMCSCRGGIVLLPESIVSHQIQVLLILIGSSRNSTHDIQVQVIWIPVPCSLQYVHPTFLCRYPLDVVRRRIQLSSEKTQYVQYRLWQRVLACVFLMVFLVQLPQLGIPAVHSLLTRRIVSQTLGCAHILKHYPCWLLLWLRKFLRKGFPYHWPLLSPIFVECCSKKGVFGTLVAVYQQDGVQRGLYRGLSLNFIRVVPQVAVSFTVYEKLKQFYGIHKT